MFFQYISHSPCIDNICLNILFFNSITLNAHVTESPPQAFSLDTDRSSASTDLTTYPSSLPARVIYRFSGLVDLSSCSYLHHPIKNRLVTHITKSPSSNPQYPSSSALFSSQIHLSLSPLAASHTISTVTTLAPPYHPQLPPCLFTTKPHSAPTLSSSSPGDRTGSRCGWSARTY